MWFYGYDDTVLPTHGTPIESVPMLPFVLVLCDKTSHRKWCF